MRILILGSNGMLGHVVCLYLASKGHEIFGFAKTDNPFIKTVVSDIRKFDELKRIIVEGKFEYIINCAALLVSESESNKADSILINSYLPHFISDVTKELQTKLIHISTDSVFSGIEKNKYYDADKKDCSRFYDLTKSIGEVNDNKNITLRSSVIGLESKNTTKSLINWFLNQTTVVEGYDRVFWCGITNLQYAKVIDQIIKLDLSGTFNISNNESISKGDLLRLVNEHIRRDKIKIISNVSIESHRLLIHSNYLDEIEIPSYENMIIELKKWIINNISYYEYFYGDRIREMIDIEGNYNEQNNFDCNSNEK